MSSKSDLDALRNTLFDPVPPDEAAAALPWGCSCAYSPGP